MAKIGPYVNEPKLYTDTFDLLVLQVILGSFGALVCNSNAGVHSEKRSEIWKSGVAVYMYMYIGYLNLTF